MKEELIARIGKSKTAARRYVSEYLKHIREEERLVDDKLFQHLAQFHPARKFPLSSVFVLRRCPPFYTAAVYVEAKCGGYVDFSWIKCIENLYGSYDKEKNKRSNTLSALRNEAFRSKLMQDARAGLGSECDRCKNRCPKLVLDHADKPFARIVDEFLEENGVTLEQLKVKGSRHNGFRLTGKVGKDRLGRSWRKFHDQNAVLVGLCAKCNCSLGSRGYKHTKAVSAQAD